MKPTAEETHLTRWIDGELSEEEAAELLRDHPDWREQGAAAIAIGDQLRASVSIEKELPYADFFSHQIRRRIEGDVFEEDEKAPATRDTETAPESAAPFFSLFGRLRWLAGVGFIVTFGALVAFVMNQNTGASHRSEIVSTYTPDPNVTVTTSYHPEADATVIQLVGAPDSPASVASPISVVRANGRVLFQLDSDDIGRSVSVLAGDDATDEMPGTILVGF